MANPLILILSHALPLLLSLLTFESGALPIIRHQPNQKVITEICLSADFLVLFSLSVLCANHWQLFFLFFSVNVYFFFTSFTINASESHAGHFRYHTESTELSKVRVANTQCREKITKYDFFSDKLCSHCEMNELLSSF